MNVCLAELVVASLRGTLRGTQVFWSVAGRRIERSTGGRCSYVSPLKRRRIPKVKRKNFQIFRSRSSHPIDEGCRVSFS